MGCTHMFTGIVRFVRGGGIWRRAFRLWFRVRNMGVMGGSTTTYPPASHLVKEPHIVAHSHQGVR